MEIMPDSIEWDSNKERANIIKHGVSFSNAIIVLQDDMAITIEDIHPDERRFVTIGMDDTGKILVVVYTFRGESIRIISARKATAKEIAVYQGKINE
jgi:uncharacterized DUF497 family protein